MVEWWRYVVIVVLVLLSGTFSGLTLGLLGLDNNNLEVFADSSRLFRWGPSKTNKLKNKPDMRSV